MAASPLRLAPSLSGSRRQSSSIARPSLCSACSSLLSSRSQSMSTLFSASSSTISPPRFQSVTPSLTTRRHASYIRRPKRPYTFTQLVTLSDGSTYLHRSTSPAPIHRSTKDARNSPLWNPSSVHLRTVEADAAGRLRAFRARFGRGWDAAEGASAEVKSEAAEAERAGVRALKGEDGEDGEEAREGLKGKREEATMQQEEGNLFDMIADFERDESVEKGMQSKKPVKAPVGGGKKK